MEKALVVGTRLIGTSVALALREKGVAVYLSDIDGDAVRLARELGAGQEWTGEEVDVALIAVPPPIVEGAAGRSAEAGDCAGVHRRGQCQGRSDR